MSIEKFMNAYCILTIFNLSSPLGQLKRSKEETTTIISSASTKVCESEERRKKKGGKTHH